MSDDKDGDEKQPTTVNVSGGGDIGCGIVIAAIIVSWTAWNIAKLFSP